MRGHRYHRLLVGLMPTALILLACSGTPSAPAVQEQVTPSATTESDAPVITINVDLTDTGFEPGTISIPAGRQAQLVLRNRGTVEHHYRIVGLVPEGLLWISDPTMAREEGVSDGDHELHHAHDFVGWRAVSPAGIRPMGDEVHGYAMPRSVDVIRFVATNIGTFVVEDSLNRELTGEVVVFGTAE